MGIALLVLAVLSLGVVGLAFFMVGIYNQLIQVGVNADKAWANIDVILKQRYDEIPKLIKVCEGYMKYERDTLEKITAARTQFLNAKTPGQAARAEGMMTGALKSLFAVSENYPDLKANANFRQLQERISALENQIADRREFYNDSVAVFNSRIRQIPYVFVANILAYRDREMFKVAEAEKTSPEIDFKFPQNN